MKHKLWIWGVFGGTSLLAGMPAIAQDQPMEEVVVTGSLIKGTPEDAALPVEVFTASDLRDVGAPTALEFVKSLTVSGPTTGESYYFTGSYLNGNVGYNLRGIGSDKTLTLFNGRRMFENSSTIPASALARVEILKDGAAVTYGADATGGVVNYITKTDFRGLEVSTSYKALKGSQGDWSLNLLGGFGSDSTNVMVAVEWDHRSEIDTNDRDFTGLPYGVNPAPWSTLTNVAGWLPRGTLPATPTNTANGEWGSAVGGIVSDFTQASCEAVGGIYQNSYTCAYGYVPFYNVVDQNEIYRVYVQVNSDITDDMAYFAEAGFTNLRTPHAYGSPSQPVTKGPARATGLTYQFYVPVTNPYVADLYANNGLTVPSYVKGLTPVTFRMFAHGGNPGYQQDGNTSMPNFDDTKYWHFSTGIDGAMVKDIGYNVSLTYNQYEYTGQYPDTIGFRIQEALNGFGGPDCDVPDLDPVRFGTQNAALAGTGNCMWLNPFDSNFKNNPSRGLANPRYIEGHEIPVDLVHWIYNMRKGRDDEWNLALQAVFSGELPFELPGGAMAWGAGAEWRTDYFRESNNDALYNGSQPCAWPGQMPALPTDPTYTGCTPDEPGPFTYYNTDAADEAQRNQDSYFLELELPILETLHVTAATRYEDFGDGLDTTVWKGSLKWDITDNFALRGSYGTNYQAPGLTVVPGAVTNGVVSYTVAAGNWRGAQTVTRTDIVPETATVWSAGAIWQSEGFTDGSDFRFIVDYFDIETQDELGYLATAGDIAISVFHIDPQNGHTAWRTDGTALADCSHPLVGRVTFNGDCVQGVTNAGDFSQIRRDYGNGPGQHTAGFDIQSNYDFPAFSGEIRVALTVTKVQKFEFTETVLDGYQLDPGEDRLGHLNFATIASAAPEMRANLSVNYARDMHNLRFVLNYTKGVDDERYTCQGCAKVPAGYQPGTTDPFPATNYGVKGEDWISGDLHYNVDLAIGNISASIVNLLDRDPPPAQEELGYDPFMGSPLGRTFEIGWRKAF